jgi:cytochrome c oxidase assembly protein subunit 15
MLFLLLLTTLAAGALVAGNRAGWIYNEFPLMGGQWIPAEYGSLQPWWQNGISNHAAVQFHHRWLGVLTALLAIMQWGAFGLRQGVDRPLRRAVAMIAILALLQAGLGISTPVAWRADLAGGGSSGQHPGAAGGNDSGCVGNANHQASPRA